MSNVRRSTGSPRGARPIKRRHVETCPESEETFVQFSGVNSAVENGNASLRESPSGTPLDYSTAAAADQSDHELEKNESEQDENVSDLEVGASLSSDRPIFTSTFNPLASLSGFTGAVDQRVTEDIVETYFNTKSRATHKVEMYPGIDESMLQEYLGLNEDTSVLFETYQGLFDYWYHQLKSGFNVLLHGMGSKIKLLSDFRNTHLSRNHLMVVYGFFPALSLKEVFNTLMLDIFEHSEHFKSLKEQCQFICSLLCTKESPVKELFLVIHNIDGHPLQDKKIQDTLSLLATCPCIHIIASVDHPRASLLWDEITMSRFNWVWHHTPTYEQYTTEQSYDRSGTSQRSDALVIASFHHVMSSLTPNAKGVFLVLANIVLQYKDDATFVGLGFNELYQKCRERFLVSSDVSLRAQLTEFKDHKLVQFKKGQDGAELLTIPIKMSVLEQLVDN